MSVRTCEVYGYINEDGKLKLPDKILFDAFISNNKGKAIILKIERRYAKRSNAQLRYYWGVVVQMVNASFRDLGNDVDAMDTHHFLKDKFNGKDFCNKEGEVIGIIGGSTTLMNKLEFMDYLAKIQIWAATYLCLTIPDPSSSPEIDFQP